MELAAIGNDWCEFGFLEGDTETVKKIIIIIVFLGGGVIAIFTANHLMLGKPLAYVLESDSRNSGIQMTAHYGNYVVSSVLVLDLRKVSGRNSSADVFRVLLQYAEAIQKKEFKIVNLACKGKTKFVLKGDYFRELGKEYDFQNPVYTMRTFPENIYNPDGKKAFPSWTGGLIGVTGKQMEDFAEFHQQWYINDLIEEF